MNKPWWLCFDCYQGGESNNVTEVITHSRSHWKASGPCKNGVYHYNNTNIHVRGDEHNLGYEPPKI